MLRELFFFHVWHYRLTIHYSFYACWISYAIFVVSVHSFVEVSILPLKLFVYLKYLSFRMRRLV